MPAVAVALSGGVDSAVAAARLVEAGHEVVGIFARFVSERVSHRWRDAEDAVRALGRRLSIDLHVIDLSAAFKDLVVRYFIDGYAQGETPNPCLVCNAEVKFGLLLREALALGCDTLATGHYVIKEQRGPRWGLRRARDLDKDQSYVLMRLDQSQLSKAIFVHGHSVKAEIIEEARRRGLPAVLRESQDVCFLDEPYGAFLERYVRPQPGPVFDLEGRELGRHRGLIFYTVGQRRGVGIGGAQRLYVVAKDPSRNALILGPREALMRRRFTVRDVNWVSISPPKAGEQIRCHVMVRYRGRLIQATVTPTAEGSASVEVAHHDQAVAPGQGAAFYDDDGWLLGGGFIASDDATQSPPAGGCSNPGRLSAPI